MPFLIFGVVAVAAVLFLPRLVQAAGGGTFASEPIDSLISRFNGVTKGQVPREALVRLEAHAASFDRPPAVVGHWGWVLVPVPPDFTFNEPILVRRTAQERAHDLPGFRNWAGMPDGYVMRKSEVLGQRDWGFLGTGITPKDVGGIVGRVV